MEEKSHEEVRSEEVIVEKTVAATASKEVPVVLQVLGVVMCVIGAWYIFIGFPLLLLLGFGLIPITIGAVEIMYGIRVFRAQKNAYMGALVIGAVALAFDLMWGNVMQALLSAAFIYIIHTHKAEFTR